MSRLLLAVPACFVLAACVSTNAVELNPSVARAPVCPNAVKIFTSADRVGKPYVEIAVLNSKGESQWTDERKMFESQRNKAAKMGANGLIMDGIKEPSAGSKVAGAISAPAHSAKAQPRQSGSRATRRAYARTVRVSTIDDRGDARAG